MKTKLAIRVLTARVWSRSSDAAKESAQFLNVQSALRCFVSPFSHLIWSCLCFSFLEGDVRVQDLPVQVRPQRLRALLPEPAPIKLPSMQVRTCNFTLKTDRVRYLKQGMIFMIWPKCDMVAPSRFPLASTLYNCLQRLDIHHSDIQSGKRRVL